MSRRSERAAHAALMWLLTLPFILYWLPFLRSIFDGASYEWGHSLFGRQFSGAGLGGDFWFPCAGVALGIACLWSGWRGPDRLFRPLALSVVAVWLTDAIHTIASGEDIEFEGATLGMTLSVGRIFLGYYLVLLALLLWSFRAPARPALPLGRANQLLLLVVILLLPIQYAVLSSGRGQEASDQIGVLITIGQWLLLSAAFALGSLRGRI
ncbi:MAG TPA: hypothetical protein VGW40_12540 [Allosphingosinicella sp.]|nr:hypothetical protein [Allosphingosinicella sp.]